MATHRPARCEVELRTGTKGGKFRWLLTVLCLVLASCSKEVPKKPAEPRVARVVEIHMQGGGVHGEASGIIESRYNARVGFQVGGRLVARNVDVGTVVDKGTVLAQLDAIDFQNRLAAAQSQLNAANAEVKQATPQEARQKILLKQGYTTRVDYDRALRAVETARSHVDEAQANLRLAKDQVGYATLTANTAGAVTAVGADPGQVVNAGQMIAVISQLDAREGVFSVSERALSVISPGTLVHVSLQFNPAIAVEGTVREISPEADPVTGTYTVRVSLPNAPDSMRLGALVTGSIQTKGQAEAVIPTGCLLQSRDKPEVWVVSMVDKTVHLRPVVIDRFDANTVTISSGLKEGELVVTAGVNWLGEGEKVSLPDGVSQ
jgi:RND family efflux transporter MFP subunit